MLTHLHIQGLAVIEKLGIDFTDGLNVITGETGAGKSILIKALSLLFGAKTSSEALRSGCEEGVVSGSFYVAKTHAAFDFLKRLGISAPLDAEGEGATILLRRQFGLKSKSSAWLNDTPVAVGTLKDLAQILVDIFGQHENQKLLDAHQHIHFLDDFLGDTNVLSAYQELYTKITEDLKNLRLEIESFTKTGRNADYYAYRLEELQKFNPSKNDFEEVLSLCKNAAAMSSVQKSIKMAAQIFEQGLEGETFSSALWQVSRILTRSEGIDIIKTEIDNIATRAANLAEEVDSLAFAVAKLGTGFEFDEDTLEMAQTRLAGYQGLFRKFSVLDVDGLVAEQQRLQQEIEKLNSFSKYLSQHLNALLLQCQALPKLAKNLSSARRKAAQKVKQEIEKELSDLAMPGARLEIEFFPVTKILPDWEIPGELEEVRSYLAQILAILSEYSDKGQERVQFLLASNPGEALHPLHKIASGGEVSRIMLAFKRVLSLQADSCLLVFDEIDTGISGKTAAVVGKKIKQLAEKFQVLCISHLPQVASYADSHFRVEKFKAKDRTESRIVKLDKKQSLEEIARLLSGTEVTKQSLANAKTLLARAQG